MSFFAGLSAGIGEAQGQYNQKMMDFMTEKSKTMANLYGHLADTVMQNGDPYGIGPDLLDRSMKWSQAHPLFNPKEYKDLVKTEKGGIHGIIDQAHQRKVTGSMYGDSSFQPHSNFGQDQGFQPHQQPGPQPSPVGNTGGASYDVPSIQELMDQITGGEPMYGPLGTQTPTGRIAMSVIPQVMEHRMDLQNKMHVLQSSFDPKMGGIDQRSPTGSAQYSQYMRAMGLNVPVTQWRPAPNTLYRDENGQIQFGLASQSLRDQSYWVSSAPGVEKQITPIDENVKIETRPDGSLWAISNKGAFQLPGNVPVQAGNTSSTQEIPEGTATTSQKRFSQGNSVTFPYAAPPNSLVPDVPVAGIALPPGVNPGAASGPPHSRTSTPKPNEVYKPTGGGFSLERLEDSKDWNEKHIALWIMQPEAFDESGKRKEMWDRRFYAATNGTTLAPVPIREFKTDFQKQRQAIVQGFQASKNIGNILNDTDGQLVGFIAGRWIEAMNKIGVSAGMRLLPGQKNGDVAQVTPQSIKQIMAQIAADPNNGVLAHRLTAQSDLLAAKAADLITTMRLFNFADVKNTVGGVQGVSRVYSFLKDSLMQPGMDMPFILGHLQSLNRNMADGLLTLEQARWGNKIPYIREKELMAQLYWGEHVNQLVKKYQAAAAEKGTTLSRQDAVFLLWRNGKIEADPGDTSYESFQTDASRK